MSTLVSPSPERYIDKRELAEILQVSVRWIDSHREAGMPSYKFGRGVRFRLSEVVNYFEGIS